jgi:hypothetical protein
MAVAMLEMPWLKDGKEKNVSWREKVGEGGKEE